MKDRILTHIEDPDGLERVYRGDRRGFAKALLTALVERPDALLLKAWRARLEPEAASARVSGYEVWVVTLLALLGGLVFKQADWFPDMDMDWFYPRVAPLGVLWGLLLYLLWNRKWPRPHTYRILGAAAVLSVWYQFLPMKPSDAWVLSWGHTSFLFWLVLGAAFAGRTRPRDRDWLEYFRYNGEQIIHSGILLLGGTVLAIMAFGLFELLGIGTGWIWDYVVLFGAAAIPVVAAHMALRQGGWRLAPLVARIFAPLFLILCVGYLLTMLFVSNDIFGDRDALLIFNILLASVLGLAVFAIVGRAEGEGGRLTDRVTGALVGVALTLDVVALWAILGRLFAQGLTPNRIAVTGGNLVMLGHLAVLFWAYVKFFRGRAGAEDLEMATAKYLPVYAVWMAFVVFVFPFIF